MAENRKIRILFAASEAVPFAKTGGLGDVAGSLPRALNAAGAECSVIMPLYGSIPHQYKDAMQHVADFYVPLAWRNVYCGIEKLTYKGVDFYFVDNEAYFNRDGYYGYFDDGERFAFFAKAICEAIQWLPELQVDVLHCNDWETAMAPVFLREFYQNSDACRHVKTVFTVHNVKFQGQFSDNVLSDILGLADNPAAAGQLYVDRDSINYMKGALCYSDMITTVSPSYASELQMPFYGEGMDDIFRRRSSVLRGILNGIDTEEWNPATDDKIAQDYTIDNLEGKAADKLALQRELGLREDPERPLVVMIGRLTNQKGLGLVRYAMNRLMERSVQVAILGTGDKDQEDAFKYFDWTYGDMMSANIRFDSDLSHRMYAGGDILLMPSEFEPCGLSQMIAMRYGTLPVVRETGGLQDSVVPYNKYTGEGTGFRFANMNADEMADTLLEACEVFWTDKDAWRRLQHQAMSTDFSWKVAAGQYLDAYYDLNPELDRSACKPAEEEQEPEKAAEPETAPAAAPAKSEQPAESEPAKAEEAPAPAAEKAADEAAAADEAPAAEPEKPAEPEPKPAKAEKPEKEEPKPAAEPEAKAEKPAPKAEKPAPKAEKPAEPKAEPAATKAAKADTKAAKTDAAPAEKAEPAKKPATRRRTTAKKATTPAAKSTTTAKTAEAKKPAAKKPATTRKRSTTATAKASTTAKRATSTAAKKPASASRKPAAKPAATKAASAKTTASKASAAKPAATTTKATGSTARKPAASKASTAKAEPKPKK